MRILFSMTGKDPKPWLSALRQALPDADIREWAVGDVEQADYALVWKPSPEVLRHRSGLKAIFNMGSGADWILALLANHPELARDDIPIYRIEDAGMASQMVEYATYATLRHFRRFDRYERQQRDGVWEPFAIPSARDFKVGVLGLGSLGAAVARHLALFGFDVRGYSRSPKSMEGVASFSGREHLSSFLDGVSVLINLLPNTPQTSGILNAETFASLARGAHVVNLARGDHLIDDDLLEAIQQGQISGASLDVFTHEPLPIDHPFWRNRSISITPHISALTRMEESVEQVAQKIHDVERGKVPTGRVDVLYGY
ncbi:glyoxylate reductase [Pandoraea sputorum]|uniref:Glyoxylate reductase n=2 Tax=Pandoraea sputorum TaxID=93222 RepID=A0A5E5BIE6_9BURK|nr:glyoxylate reductase [Pandoraea sputorum]